MKTLLTLRISTFSVDILSHKRIRRLNLSWEAVILLVGGLWF